MPTRIWIRNQRARSVFFKTRTEVNLVCLMKGEMPQQKDEIAIDRMYADNNDPAGR